MHRRSLFTWLAGGASLAVLAGCSGPADATSPRGRFPVTRTDAEWRRRLTAEQYYVLRDHGTERAGTSPLDRERRRGNFHCAGCDQALFSSTTKYDSGTGWPSFWQPLPRAIGTSTDRLLGYARVEVHCSRCGGHLGHVFDDGPQPTGKRYCMNGDAMIFRAA